MILGCVAPCLCEFFKVGEMYSFAWGGSVCLLGWMLWFLISLIGLKFVFCRLCNTSDGLNKFCLRLLSNFGLLSIWCSLILLLSLFSTLLRSSRILANFDLFSASSRFSNIFLLALDLLELEIDLDDQELFEDIAHAGGAKFCKYDSFSC